MGFILVYWLKFDPTIKSSDVPKQSAKWDKRNDHTWDKPARGYDGVAVF